MDNSVFSFRRDRAYGKANVVGDQQYHIKMPDAIWFCDELSDVRDFQAKIVIVNDYPR